MMVGIYLLTPVPLGLLGMLGFAMLVTGSPPSIEGLLRFLGAGLVLGYTLLGIPSAVFALLMLWLEHRRVGSAGRFLVAGILSCLSGASVAWTERDSGARTAALFAALGAIAGPLTVALVELVRPAPGRAVAPPR